MVGPRILGIACAAASEPQLCHYVSFKFVDAAQGKAHICNQALQAFAASSPVPREISL